MQQTLISPVSRESSAERGKMSPAAARVDSPPSGGVRAGGRLFDAHDFCVAELPVPEIWDRISGIAVREQASDVHVTAQRDGAPLALRLDGRLYGQGALIGDIGQRLVNHVKVLARLDVSERRRPQDGSLRCEVDGRPVDLRISTLPTIHGEDLSVRILDRASGLMRVAQLGATASQTAQINGLLTCPSGLILVSGSTGAGKTTTLYALVQQLADGSRKIVTIEDPVEYDLPGVSQSAVCARLGLDYATLLRSVLRQDPNIIMLGEIRDAQTAATVVRAANSGRLVLATSHATSAAAAVESLTALGAHPYYVARALRGVISQTLVRRLCRYCAERLDETVDEPIFTDVRTLLSPGETPALSMARGCGHCRHTGYRERVGVFEVMTVSDELRHGITEAMPAARIHEIARSEGMIPIADAARLAALRGMTTIEELLSNISED